MYNDSVVRYNAQLYTNDKGEKYYIFRGLDKIIKLNDNIPIVIPSGNEDDNENFIIIPFSYRHTEGFGGSTIIQI